MSWPSHFHNVRTNIDSKTLANDTNNRGQVVHARVSYALGTLAAILGERDE